MPSRGASMGHSNGTFSRACRTDRRTTACVGRAAHYSRTLGVVVLHPVQGEKQFVGLTPEHPRYRGDQDGTVCALLASLRRESNPNGPGRAAPSWNQLDLERKLSRFYSLLQRLIASMVASRVSRQRSEAALADGRHCTGASRSPPALARKRRKRRSSVKAELRLHQGRSPSRHIRRPASARPASARRRLEKQRKQRGPRTVPLPPAKPLALARSLKNNCGAKSLAVNRLFRPGPSLCSRLQGAQ